VAPSLVEDVFREIARLAPPCHGLAHAMLLPSGVRLEGPILPKRTDMPATGGGASQASASDGALALLSGGTLFADGGLSARTSTLARLAGEPPRAALAAEAAKLGARAGDRVELRGPAGSLTFPLEIDDTVPAGAVFVPYAGAELNPPGGAHGGRPCGGRSRRPRPPCP